MFVLKFNYAFLFIYILSYPVMASDENTYIKAETIKMIKNDIPTYVDLMVYLPMLDRIFSFCEQNDFLSMNLVHGLFLLDVNLGPFVNDDDIPEALRIDLRKLIMRSDNLQNKFNSLKTGTKMKKLVSALASNATSWSKRVQKLNFNLLYKTNAYGEYPQWGRYLTTIKAIEKGTPDPRQSDLCVGSLVESEDNLSEDVNRRCKVPKECYKSIINGTDFGYWLTHRLILLLHARLGRNCAIFSAHEDELYRVQFCERAYREAEYIALNGFQIADLLMQQIAMCALDGNAQFLRRSWLVSILEYQQPCGCFQLEKLSPADEPNIDNCDDYSMAVALPTYGAAIRLILENLITLIE